jgi:hypothetical protein
LTARRSRAPILALGRLGARVARSANAAASAERVAQRCSPAVRLVAQTHECRRGEPYEPSDANRFLGQDAPALRGSGHSHDLIDAYATAAGLGKGLDRHDLAFPGSALIPGCDHEPRTRTFTAACEPTVDAHVATEAARPGKHALRYVLPRPFAHSNNNHEGDREMIQLVFGAADANRAFASRPVGGAPEPPAEIALG